MNFTVAPSLQHRTLVKTALMLLNDKAFWADMAQVQFTPGSISPRMKMVSIWSDAEDRIKRKIPTLCIPEYLGKKLMNVVEEICLEILRWRQYHDINSYLCVHRIDKLCWKPQGTIDKKKTAEILIKDENYELGKSLNIMKRYKLACIYCLEDDVVELWAKMTEEQKDFVNVPRNASDEHDLVLFWTYWKNRDCATMLRTIITRMNGKLERTQHARTNLQCVFEYSVSIGNEAATEFFWEKLCLVEREASLVRSAGYAAVRRNHSLLSSHLIPSVTNRAPNENFTNILFFLLAQMDEENQNNIFKRYPCEVLSCLLDWPRQDMFMKTANYLWEHLNEENLENVLKAILDKAVHHGYTNCQYLFAEFWQCCPIAYKKYMTDHRAGGHLVYYLFITENRANIKLFFESTTVAERRKFIFCEMGKNTCRYLIECDKWDLLEFFIRECISSENELRKLEEEFREEFNASADNHRKLKCVTDKENKFFNLLKYFVWEDGKRKNEETENAGPSKKMNGMKK